MKSSLFSIFLVAINLNFAHGGFVQNLLNRIRGTTDGEVDETEEVDQFELEPLDGGMMMNDGPFRGGPPGIQFFNDTCAADSDAEPACLVGGGRRGTNETAGAWVCRTLFDIVTGEQDTFSACVDLEHFIETDVCGCCGGECPSIDPCPCGCNLTAAFEEMGTGDMNNTRGSGRGRGPPGRGPDGGEFHFGNETGVLVQFEGETEPKCVPSSVSSHLITGPGFYGRPVCVEQCT